VPALLPVACPSAEELLWQAVKSTAIAVTADRAVTSFFIYQHPFFLPHFSMRAMRIVQ
jgi:hypothetical protein